MFLSSDERNKKRRDLKIFYFEADNNFYCPLNKLKIQDFVKLKKKSFYSLYFICFAILFRDDIFGNFYL